MRAKLVLALVLLTVLAGCMRGPDGAPGGEPDVSAVQVSGDRAVIENQAPYDVESRMRLVAPDGEVLDETVVVVKSKNAVVVDLAAGTSGLNRVEGTFQWTHEGRGGSDTAVASFDPSECAGDWVARFTLHEEDGQLVPGASAHCGPT